MQGFPRFPQHDFCRNFDQTRGEPRVSPRVGLHSRKNSSGAPRSVTVHRAALPTEGRRHAPLGMADEEPMRPDDLSTLHRDRG